VSVLENKQKIAVGEGQLFPEISLFSGRAGLAVEVGINDFGTHPPMPKETFDSDSFLAQAEQ